MGPVPLEENSRGFCAESGCFLVLRKALLVSYCVVVRVLSLVFVSFVLRHLVIATPRNCFSLYTLNQTLIIDFRSVEQLRELQLLAENSHFQ